MRKFEKAPDSKVIFNTDAPVMVRSKVPGSEFPLMQCLAGKGRWGDGHVGNGVEMCSADVGQTRAKQY